MPSTGPNRGGLAAIYVDGVKVGYSTNASISIEMGTRDVTTKDSDKYVENLEGLISWSASGDFIFAEDATEGFEELFDDVDNRRTVTFLWSTNVSGDVTLGGNAYVTSLNRTAGIDSDTETFSASFTGAGTLTKSTV